ncbi:MAG: hypothetical protein F4Y81_10885 [Rhodothermaceae bacterium]|nr:hypothetical protein [Rhodothermaceae bacterium]MYG70461.1 hypothetical protein [Rhodothermaceae bacterium]
MSDLGYLPPEEVSGLQPNLDLAADYLELKAVLSKNKFSLSHDIVAAMEMSYDYEFENVAVEMKERERVVTDTIGRIQSRKEILQTTYPFDLDERGETISFTSEQPNFAHTAYLISLLLSNLRAVSPLLDDFEEYPSDSDVRILRQYFQYIATTAIAGEIGGRAWSFGFPRPDHSGFLDKLTEIWGVLKDGNVEPDISAPSLPKDDGVDVFACKEPKDGLPGFLLVAAQVATGNNWKAKTILSHINNGFKDRWFGRNPVTKMIAYHVIPFARPDEIFRDDVSVLGNVLHRTRIPSRVIDAEKLVEENVEIEGFNKLEEASDWVKNYFNL